MTVTERPHATVRTLPVAAAAATTRPSTPAPTGGTLASDEALQALREKLSGGA